MKVYSVLITDSRKKESHVSSSFEDERKAYIDSIWYNLSDLEEIEDLDNNELLIDCPNQIKNFIKAYFDNDSLISIDQLKLCLETFATSRLMKFQEILEKIQTNRPYYSVSKIIEEIE